jgi:hypothetical protein
MTYRDFRHTWHDCERTTLFSKEWSTCSDHGFFQNDLDKNDRFALVLQEKTDVYVVLSQENPLGLGDVDCSIFFKIVRLNNPDWDLRENRPKHSDEIKEKKDLVFQSEPSLHEYVACNLRGLKGITLDKGVYYILPGATVDEEDVADGVDIEEVSYQVRVYAKVKRRDDFWLTNVDQEDREEELNDDDGEKDGDEEYRCCDDCQCDCCPSEYTCNCDDGDCCCTCDDEGTYDCCDACECSCCDFDNCDCDDCDCNCEDCSDDEEFEDDDYDY